MIVNALARKRAIRKEPIFFPSLLKVILLALCGVMRAEQVAIVLIECFCACHRKFGEDLWSTKPHLWEAH